MRSNIIYKNSSHLDLYCAYMLECHWLYGEGSNTKSSFDLIITTMFSSSPYFSFLFIFVA